MRPHLDKPAKEMKHYIVNRVYPRVMDRTVISRKYLDEIMDDIGLPLSFCGLTYYERCTVLVETLRVLGWKKYSKGNRNRINAWTLPEVAACV